MASPTLAVTAKEAARARLASLLLPAAPNRSAAEVTSWFGAMQSQDYSSGLWSLGARMSESTLDDILDAFERAEVLRTWPMRGTIHTVASSDARWLLDLTGTRALQSSIGRRNQLELDDATSERAALTLVDVLTERGRISRKDALSALQSEGIDTSGQRGYHLLWYAAQTGRTCIGPHDGSNQTFVLLDSWAPEQTTYGRDDALIELAYRYFRSHGPASERDFAGWSGLTLTDCRRGIVGNQGRLRPITYDGVAGWVSAEIAEQVTDGQFRRTVPCVVLPGFDEFVLGYKDRTVQIPEGGFERIVPGGNGVFRATVCLDGRVAGTWTRSLRASGVDIVVEPLTAFSRTAMAQISRAFELYGHSLGLPVRLTTRQLDA